MGGSPYKYNDINDMQRESRDLKYFQMTGGKGSKMLRPTILDPCAGVPKGPSILDPQYLRV